MENTLKGIIYNEFNEPMQRVLVKAFDRDLRAEELLGEATTDAKGQYSITYKDRRAAKAEKKTADVFLRVFWIEVARRQETAQSPIHYNVPKDYVFDFKIDGTSNVGLSEFDTLLAAIAPLLTRQQGVQIHELQADDDFDDFNFLSKETGIDPALLALLAIAYKYNIKARGDLPAYFFYGLMRVGFPGKYEELLGVQEVSILKGLEEAMSKNIISAKWRKELQSLINQFNHLSSIYVLQGEEPEKVAFRKMIGATIPKPEQQERFIATYYATETQPEKFWAKLAEQPGFTDGTLIQETQKVLSINLLTNQPALATRLYEAHPDLKENRDFARLNSNDFKEHITDLVQSGAFGDFPPGIAGETPEEKTESYAVVLEDLLLELFPTDVFKFRMVADQDGPFGATKSDLETFLVKNPTLELASTRLNSELKTADFSGVDDRIKLEGTLKKVNRLAKLSPRYDHTKSLLKAGLDSAASVARLSKEAFTERTGGSIPAEEAGKIHQRAGRIDQRTTALAVTLKMSQDGATYATHTLAAAHPDHQSMFGDNVLCECEHCQSVYSPAAYLVDMLGFMRKQEKAAFDELDRRRPDLKHILLTCKNTNTRLPYIDPLNEILERQVENAGPVDAARVPQTNNSAEELAAFPEHENEAVYTTLANDFSSIQLPFNLPLERVRTFLDKVKCKRHELMELFFGGKAAEKYNDIPVATEYLALSAAELAYINDPEGLPGPDIEDAKINEVTYYLQLTGLTYADLLELLESDYLNEAANNGSRPIELVGDNDDLTTCDLNLLRLEGLDRSVLKEHLRFIRLWKKLKWSLLEMNAFFITFGKPGFDLTPALFNVQVTLPLSHTARLKEAFKLSVAQVASLWSGLASDLITAFGVSQSEFDLYNQAPVLDNIPVQNLPGSFYRYTILAKKLNLPIEELLRLIDLTGIVPFADLSNTAATLTFIDIARFLKAGPFSITEVYSLLKPDVAVTPETNDLAIAGLFTDLRRRWQEIEQDFPVPADRLVAKKDLIEDSIITALDTSSSIASLLLNEMVQFTADANEAAIKPFLDIVLSEAPEPLFIEQDNGVITWLFPDLLDTYIRLTATKERLSLLMDKLSITEEEFLYLQKNETILQLNGVWNFPTDNSPTPAYEAFESLLYFFQFRNSLAAAPSDWLTFFNAVILNDAGAKGRFVDSLVALTTLEKTAIETLTGIGAEAGALQFTFPDDYVSGKNLLNILACAKKASDLGVTVGNLSDLTTALTPSAAETAESIWKAKYNETDWMEAIRPINDALRQKKRNALVSYLLHAPEVSAFRATNDISAVNDLYAHFLIDTQMSSCMMTSRIKLAISSVQLFIDRVLMGLEPASGVGQAIEVGEKFATQWNEWRKVYRVWEANRKIFLYPENYIKPELRGGKSPFFKELEDKLTQNAVTKEIAKDALLEYLEKLDTVANLEIIAFFPDESTNITHVLGRTKNIPHQYFYRKQEKSIWSPWENVELDIQGDHVLMVVWNNHLMVFWGEFAEKQSSSGNGVSLTLSGDQNNGTITSPSPVKYLEMKLNWSEYKNGRWGAKKISENAIKVDYTTKVTIEKVGNVVLRSSFYDDKLFIRIWIAVGGDNITSKKMISFDNCNSSPLISNSGGLNLKKINGTELDFPFLKEDQKNRLTIYQSGSGMLQLRSDQKAEIVLFSNSPKRFQLLANHHQTRTSKTTFFYGSSEHTFFVESTQRRASFEQVDNAGIQGVRFLRGEINPTSVPSFNNESRVIFLRLDDGLSDNGNVLPALPVAELPDLPLPVPEPTPTPEPTTTSRKKYRFKLFYHPHVCSYIDTLNTEGIDALYNPTEQNMVATPLFTNEPFEPNGAVVLEEYPVEKVDFSIDGTYSLYNWELFFHIPLLIATSLNQNQKFEEARKWFHYVFDPTTPASTGDSSAKRFWVTKPFKAEIDNQILTIDALINNEVNQNALAIQLKHWENNPFKPHIVAGFRPAAYMRFTLMKYIDNLIDWGDQLFRRDSIESINEATLLYVLAANLLGEKPPSIPAREQPGASSFHTIKDDLDPLNNAKVIIEALLSFDEADEDTALDGIVSMPLFCLPKNDQLLKYWDTVADRLFKIRNCRNIEGVFRILPTFQPPIDPNLLVLAASAGLDLQTVLNDSQVGTPHYRFQVMLQKANEFCNDIKGLGNQLLSNLEKRDAEELSLLRSGHEVKLLELVRDIKKRQIDEAKENVKSLEATQKVTEERKNYYDSREFMNIAEGLHFLTIYTGMQLQIGQSLTELTASATYMAPDFKAGSPFTLGAIYGGTNLGNSSKALASKLATLAAINNTIGTMSSVMGGYQRRQDDWKFQAKTAELELKQLDKQIIAAQIRLDIAEKDLSNHKVQIEQSKEVGDYLRSKFTNEQLYSYMVSEVSGLFFQTYKMAYDLAKKAEKCFQLELGRDDSSFINFGYWDSLKKGLLSGEKLQLDLRRLEMAYLEENERDFELTKHISTRQLNPMALLQLKTTGTCEIDVPEMLFDMDCPGHYMRRIKAVSLSIPAIAGPYTSVNCTLSLEKSSIRKSTSLPGDYVREEGVEDPRFTDFLNSKSSIVTSNAQNDSGLFEVNFRDERFLPFENAGVISTWKLALPTAHRQFDYNTITDVILHIRYRARDGGTTLKDEANAYVTERLEALDGQKMHRLFSLRNDFPVEWHQFETSTDGANFNAIVKKEYFNFLTQGKTMGNVEIEVIKLTETTLDTLATLNNPGGFTGNINNPDSSQTEIELAGLQGDDVIFIIVSYSLA